MWYKEWRMIRLKFTIWLVLYGFVSILFLLLWPRNQEHTVPLFQDWITPAFLLTVIVSVLGGVDIISEERTDHTISFLLTRSIKRTQVYTIKLAVNSLALLTAFGLGNLIVLLYDQLNPTYITLKRWVTVHPEPDAWYSGWETAGHVSQSYNLGAGLSVLNMIALAGLSIVCLSGLFSILAHSTMQAMMFTGLTLLSVGLVTTRLGYQENYQNGYAAGSSNWLYSVNPTSAVILGISSLMLFVTGLVIFKRKAF